MRKFLPVPDGGEAAAKGERVKVGARLVRSDPNAGVQAMVAATVSMVAPGPKVRKSLAELAVKVTEAVWATTTESVVTVAVKTGEPGVVDFTVKVTTPEASEVPEAAEIVSLAPRLEARDTVLEATGVPPPSLRVTVMVEVVAPSAGTEPGVAATVELALLAGGTGANVMLAVWVTTKLSLTSVAVKTGEPVARDFTVKVATPATLVVPKAGVIVSDAPRLEASVTLLPTAGLLLPSSKVTVMVVVA